MLAENIQVCETNGVGTTAGSTSIDTDFECEAIPKARAERRM